MARHPLRAVHIDLRHRQASFLHLEYETCRSGRRVAVQHHDGAVDALLQMHRRVGFSDKCGVALNVGKAANGPAGEQFQGLGGGAHAGRRQRCRRLGPCRRQCRVEQLGRIQRVEATMKGQAQHKPVATLQPHAEIDEGRVAVHRTKVDRAFCGLVVALRLAAVVIAASLV